MLDIMEKRTCRISKFERRTNTNILGKSNSPCVRRTPKVEKRKQPSYYGQINDEVRKIRIFYGDLRYGTVKKIYQKADIKKGGDIVDKMVAILECRLPSVVFRMRWAKNHLTARQIVSHCHILVNNKVVNCASYNVIPGDVISLRPSMWENPQVVDSMASHLLSTPAHLEVNENKMSCTFLTVPKLSDISYTFNPNYLSLVEVFSR